MDCRTTLAHKFRARLGFKQYDVILTKKQSVLTKIMSYLKQKTLKHDIIFQVMGLTHIFMNITSQQKLMKMDTATEILTTK